MAEIKTRIRVWETHETLNLKIVSLFKKFYLLHLKLEPLLKIVFPFTYYHIWRIISDSYFRPENLVI